MYSNCKRIISYTQLHNQLNTIFKCSENKVSIKDSTIFYDGVPLPISSEYDTFIEYICKSSEGDGKNNIKCTRHYINGSGKMIPIYLNMEYIIAKVSYISQYTGPRGGNHGLQQDFDYILFPICKCISRENEFITTRECYVFKTADILNIFIQTPNAYQNIHIYTHNYKFTFENQVIVLNELHKFI